VKGTWQTDDRSPGGGVILLVAGVVILAASGAAAAVATAVIVLLAAAAAVVVLTVAALAVFLLYRARHPAPVPRGIVPAPALHELPAPGRPAIEPPAARELHQHWHLHVGAGADAEQVAAIMRQVRENDDASLD
jgi:hypothetical protein